MNQGTERLYPLFDTHAHLDDARFDDDREALLKALPEAGIALCVCVGADMATSASSIALAKRVDYLYAAVGVHPHSAKEFVPSDLDTLKNWLLSEPKVRALGEIGLDYYYDLSPRDVQKEVFVQQLELAHALDKPVALHIRDAHGDTLDILRARRGNLPSMVLHCTSASWESTKEYMDLGCYVSFAGPVTLKRSVHLHEVAQKVPDDLILIETDSPYLSPEPVRGRRNDPRNVAHTCRFIAELRGESAAAFAKRTYENGKRFYRIEHQA